MKKSRERDREGKEAGDLEKENEPNREMRFMGAGAQREGERLRTIPSGITSVHVFMSERRSSEAFGKNAYLLPIRIS